MDNLVCYKTLPVWNKKTIPLQFQERHNTKEDTYAQLKILKGSLDFVIFNEDGTQQQFTFDVQNQPQVIQPQVWHKIASCSDDIECQLSFLCHPSLKFYKTYDLTKPHSEVRYLYENNLFSSGKVLDLGSGRGRNSFYLAMKGSDVTAVDINAQHIKAIEFIKQQEKIENIKTEIYDINSCHINENYDLILATVIFMFLKRAQVEDIITNMQAHTLKDGINLIVAAVETEDAPLDLIPFTTFFKPNELKEYYKDWEILKYNEDPGYLHRTDAQGNRIKLNFATLIAKKVTS